MRIRSVVEGIAVSVALGSVAGAQTPPTDAQRRALVDQAVQASTAGEHSRALDLFQQAGRIQMRPGLRVSLAEEYQALNLPQRACESASHGENEAQADLGRHDTARVLQRCVELVAQTCGPFARVRLHLPAPLPAGVRVTVGGRPIENVQSEDIVVAQPGTVTVSAVVSAETPFRQDLALRAGETRDVTVTFHHTDVREVVHNEPSPTSNTLRYVSIALLGVGAVAMIVGVVEWGISSAQANSVASASPLGTGDYAAYARYDNANNANRTLSFSDVCSLAASDTMDPSAPGARNVCSSNATSRALALAGVISGAALVGGGLTMFLVSRPSGSTPHADGHASRFRLTPEFAGGYRGASATWTF